MLKKTLIGVVLVACLLAPAAAPALAGQPGNDWVPFLTFGDFPLTNCADWGPGYNFSIRHIWQESEHILTFFNKDGSLDYIQMHVRMRHTFYVPGTDRSVAADTADTLIIRDPASNVFEFRGRFQQIIIPGTGPIFMDVGHKVFRAVWQPDGSLRFELISNAGPTAYTGNNFAALCAYLAP